MSYTTIPYNSPENPLNPLAKGLSSSPLPSRIQQPLIQPVSTEQPPAQKPIDSIAPSEHPILKNIPIDWDEIERLTLAGDEDSATKLFDDSIIKYYRANPNAEGAGAVQKSYGIQLSPIDSIAPSEHPILKNIPIDWDEIERLTLAGDEDSATKLFDDSIIKYYRANPNAEGADSVRKKLGSFYKNELPKTYDPFMIDPLMDINRQAQITKEEATRGLKSAAKGTASLADLIALSYNLPTSAATRLGVNIGSMPYLSNIISQAIDLKEEEQTPVDRAIEFVAGLGMTGLIGKGLGKLGMKTLAKPFNILGSTKGGALGTAGTVGAVDAIAEDAGVSAPLRLATGLGIDLFGGKLAKSALQKLASEVPLKDRLAVSLGGLSPENFKSNVYEVAQHHNVPLTSLSLTDSNALDLAAQIMGKTPIFGNKLAKRNEQTSNQIKAAIEKIADNIGPSSGPNEVELLRTQQAGLYGKALEAIGENDISDLKHLRNAIDKVKDRLGSTIGKSRSESANRILSYVNDLEDGIYTQKDSNSARQFKPASIKELQNSKRQLNEIMNELGLFSVNSKTDSSKFAHDLLHAMKDDLDEYAKKNPSYGEAYKQAEEYTKSINSRRKFDDQFAGIISDPNTGFINYKKYNSTLSNPKKQRWLYKEFGAESAKALEEIGVLAKANAQAISRTPNPSGSGAVLGLMQLLMKPVQFAPKLLLSGVVRKALLDENVQKLAYQYAKSPSVQKATALEKSLKTGYSANLLAQLARHSFMEE